MKKKLPSIILIVILIAGLSLLLYPTLSNWWNSSRQTFAIAEYDTAVADLKEEDKNEILEKAYAYNEALLTNYNRFKPSEAELAEYNSILNITGTGIMGYIEIPSIRVKLPVYHGTSDEVLAVGVGHIIGSSLPVGGEHTHSVLSGHRGLPSAKLFSDLDKLVEGDVFTLTILDQVLTYQVDQIRIVLPAEASDLLPEKGKDYCTLVTCTPYGINSHRMLVRAHRVENAKELPQVISDAIQIETTIVASVVAVPIVLFLFVLLVVSSRKKRNMIKTRRDLFNEI